MPIWTPETMNSRLSKLTNCLPELALVIFLTAVVLLCGCAEQVDEALISHRKDLLKDAAPEGFTSIETAQKNIKQSPSITFEGVADLKEMASEKPRALFMVREILEDDGHGGSSHDPSSCPFCKRRLASAPRAVVIFLDDDGQVIPYDVDALFSIEHGDEVIVEGQGKLDEGLSLFEVTASSVFVRQRKEQVH